ncbi:hypothetical protein TD95_002283 [Thielaviopsis punctulata]|uniref:Nucleolar protein 58 n=1 Tax=Thielaviopsis punctulata TaxID=72032 RepID=A0A0F4ZM22_9PEZI|nr:hypothetical protein TD95_002283 [Thielaviopsis punctulata]
MPLYVLSETPAGYGLFKAADKKLHTRDDVSAKLASVEAVSEMFKLKDFRKYESTSMALEEVASMSSRNVKVPQLLADFLQEVKDEKHASLALADKALGQKLKELPGFDKLDIVAASDSAAGRSVEEIFRALRENMNALMPETASTFERVALGLSHSIDRYKLKFTEDKVDSMIIHAVKHLEDLDQALNVMAMRTKEWYGWHFPEMSRHIADNVAYARVIIETGTRDSFATADLTTVLPEPMAEAVKAAAEISMGTDIDKDDMENIKLLARQVVTYSEHRIELATYVENRMRAIAPNLTALVGYLVGAKLIAHTGSLLNLSKSAASTIQILGAEKALFRALKTKHNTPKYGILYNSSLVGQAPMKYKGKIARMLAAKTALGLRVDAMKATKMNEDGEEVIDEEYELDEEERAFFGLNLRTKLENKLRSLEGKPLLPKGVNVGPDGQVLQSGEFTIREKRAYNMDVDAVEEAPKKPLIQEVDDTPMDGASESSDDEAGKPKKLSDKEYERLAEQAGISVSKFKRKYERGDVELNADGSVKVASKKDKKKEKKEEDKSLKRKRDEDATPSKSEKKHKKKKTAKE